MSQDGAAVGGDKPDSDDSDNEGKYETSYNKVIVKFTMKVYLVWNQK